MAKTIQHVAFDEMMDLGRFCAYSGDDKGMTGSGDRPPKARKAVMYKLMSVIEHRGNAFSGHYVAYRRDLANPTDWLLISDESVRKVTWRDVANCQAYMLFYEATL
jgi:ubiquitin C-terminal hydrolase